MPQPPTIFPKIQTSSRAPDLLSVPSAVVSYPAFGPSRFVAEPRPPHQIYRTKRKHVLKACDRCRVKKTKVCDGNQPCYRCAAYNHPCLFRERKATQTKAYSKGFVEMLESHHALVVKALQQLYTHCVKNKCFPGEPIDVVDGYPLTHAILDRLGLIKQAEKESEDCSSANFELPQLWEEHRGSETYVDSEDLSPEASTGSSSSPCSAEPSSPEKISLGPVKCETPAVEPRGAYKAYQCDEEIWPLDEQPGARGIDQSMGTTAYYVGREAVPPLITQTSSTGRPQPSSTHVQEQQPVMVIGGAYTQSEDHAAYGIQPLPYNSLQGTFGDMAHQFSWVPGPWTQ
ncbi:hypothetical protein VTO42DRAFT_1846 [Malbranchea cinnamomea]